MRALLFACIFFQSLALSGQDLGYARKVIDTLTSPAFWGRGYTNEGVNKAALFLSSEFKRWGLQPIGTRGYFQEYAFPVNTFPGKMELEINGRKLIAGKDFIVSPESGSITAKGKFEQVDSVTFVDSQNNFSLKFAKKLTWSVSTEAASYVSVVVDEKAGITKPVKYSVAIENQFIDRFPSKNICGLIKGKTVPDTLLVLTAHYDHLGGMGTKTYFPGANDNASGISMLLNFARYFSENPPDYSVALICFSGEEAGLIGSGFFSENPLFDLKKVRFLVNLDLTGTGDEGITVVNATEYKADFERLTSINTAKSYLPKVTPRGKAANSDHYWFTQKGVPSFFIYTNGGIKAYHDIYDRAETLPLTGFENLFKLLREFMANF